MASRGRYTMKKSPLVRFMEKVDATGACWIWLGATNNKGYGLFQIRRPEGGYKAELAHRFAYKAFVGPLADEIDVLHKCDVPRCVHPQHFFTGTQSDNMIDMWSKGRHPWCHNLPEGVRARWAASPGGGL